MASINNNKLKSISLVICHFMAVGLLLAACGRPNNANEKKIFRYNESSGLVNLDPAFARDQPHTWVCNQLYDGLVQLDDNLDIQPAIARSWNITDNGLTYTFHLRGDVVFHNDKAFAGKSKTVSATDFVYSLNRLTDPATASPGAWVLGAVARENNVPAITAPNDTTLIIRLSKPFPPFLGILSMPYCAVVPKQAVDFYGKDFRIHPVGTGPFQMQNWVENIKLILKKNPAYYQKLGDSALPLLDGIAISFLIDKMTAFMEFAKGNFDFMSGIDASYKDEILNKSGQLKLKYQDRFKLLGQPFLNTEYLAVLVDTSLPNVKSSPLASKKIRQALNYGFDRAKMLKYLRNNIGFPGVKGIIPNGMPAFDEKAGYGYTYQPDKARTLIQEAGYNDYHPVPAITLVTTPDYLDLIKFAQAQWQEVGLKVAIEVSPAASVREMKAQSKLPFFRASWIADYPDEENYLSLFYSENFAPNGPNYTHFSNRLYDSLFREAMTEVEPHKRQILYRHLDSLMMLEAPVIVLYYDESVRIAQKNITGLTTNPMNMLNLKKVSKE